MKRLITICCLLAVVAGMAAQTKVLDKSARRAPKWLNTAVENYLVVTVTASTMADAQQAALREIGERMAQAVASNITVSQRNLMSETNTDGHIESVDQFTRLSTLTAARLPFLKGISLSKAEDIYWQRVRDKSTGKEYYEYSVKYPFSAAEQRQLIADFEAQDAKMENQYEELEQKFNVIESAGEIRQAISRLEALEQYFFDDARLARVRSLKERYAQLYADMTVTGQFIDRHTYRCQVLLSGNPLRVDAVPGVRSNCASQLSAVPSDGAFLISFDAIDCLPEEENYLDIQFFIDGHRLKHRVPLAGTVEAGTGFSVVPEGRIILTADSVSVALRKVHNLNIRLTLNNRGGTPFGLKSIELHVPDFSAPIVFDDIDGVYTSKGVLQVKARAEGSFTALKQKKSALGFVQGAVTLVNPQSGAVERVRLMLPYVTNWE